MVITIYLFSQHLVYLLNTTYIQQHTHALSSPQHLGSKTTQQDLTQKAAHTSEMQAPHEFHASQLTQLSPQSPFADGVESAQTFKG
jgi:hypothetical protein